MPYTPWVEEIRNAFTTPTFADGSMSALYNSSTEDVTGGILTITAGVNDAPSLFAMLYPVGHPINTPWSARMQVRRKPGDTAERGLSIRPTSYLGGSGQSWGTIGNGNVTVTLNDTWQDVEFRDWVSGPTATSMGVQFVRTGAWPLGQGFQVRKVIMSRTLVCPEYIDGDMADSNLVRYSWVGTAGLSMSIRETRQFIYPTIPEGSKALRPRDILVEYRDRNLVRQGSIPIDDLKLTMQPVYNGVGSWLLQLPSEHRAVPYLRAPGAGIVVTNLVTGDIIMSGPTSKPSKKATSSDPKGLVSVAGVTDDCFLFQARAWPSPEFDQPDQAVVANDVRTDVASTLMRTYVNANIGPGSPAGRRGVSLRNAIVMGPDPSVGIITTRRPRYDVLGELLYGIALEAGLGFRMVQVNDELQFQVYQPQDRSSTIRLDVHNGTLSEQSIEVAPPEVTRMIVLGQGQGEERQAIYMTTADSTQAEEDWGIIVEEVKDQRNTDVVEELESAGMERLLEGGFTKVAVKATPANDQTMIFLTNFFMGDRVAVVVDGQEQPNSIITEAAIVVDETGMQTAVAIGDIHDFDSASALRQTVNDTVRRVDAIERNVEVPAQLTSGGKEINDWDDALDNGAYWGNGADNAPYPGMVMGRVLVSGGGTRVAEAVDPSGLMDRVSRRVFAGGVWGAWVEVNVSGVTRTGTAAKRAATPSRYWEQWIDTDGTGATYIGDRSGGWRLFSGIAAASAAAWDASGGNEVWARSANITIPTTLEVGETILLGQRNVGSGFGLVGASAIPIPTTVPIVDPNVQFRHVQFLSAATNAFSVVWQLSRD